MKTVPGRGLQAERINIKIQSVQNHFLEAKCGTELTLGQHIDDYIESEKHAGRHPNRISIDLDPPEEENPARMD